MTLPAADQQKQNILKAVREYGKRLFHFIRIRVNRREDAEDILQDVWTQFTNVMNSEPIEQTSAWLFRVARNRIIDQYRRKQTIILEEEINLEDEEMQFHLRDMLLMDTAGPEKQQLRNLFWDELFSALGELPEEQREVFILHEIEELSFRQIAEKTGENLNTLISRKRYAILHLRKRLELLYKEIIEH
jgi:RNA polymerase sigma factor (sigma-70 family)